MSGRLDAYVADAAEHAVPERTCIVTRQRREPHELLRFVASPDGEVVPDLKGRLPGRGAWVSLDRDCVAKAVERNAFSRALRCQLRVAPDLPELVDRLLEREVLGFLAIANKSGQVVQGFEKVAAALSQGLVTCLISASDGSRDGIRKLKGRAAAAAAPIAHVEALSSQQLDLALGRTHVIHAALKGAGVAERFVAAADRLDAYRCSRHGAGRDGRQ